VFVSDAPLRAAAHRPGCRFGDGFYKVIYDDELGQPRTRCFGTQAEADLLVRLLPPGRNVRGYRDECLDRGRATSDAGTPDVLDGEWWLGLPKAQAMEEAGIADEAVYARIHRAVEDVVYRRDNRATQGGVRAPVILRRKKRHYLAHLFEGGNLSDVTHIRPEEYDPTRGG